MSRKEPIYYLVFDDDDEEINQNKRKAKLSGYECNLIFINPKKFYNAKRDTFNLEKFKEKVIEKTRGKFISFVATDWNMLSKTSNHQEVNGLEVIEILLSINSKYMKIPFLIYSGNVNDASKIVISKIQDEVNNNKNDPIYSIHILNLLMSLRIKFCKRGKRFEEIIGLIRAEKTISLIVLNALSNFDENLLINTGYEDFDGKTIKSLLDLISQNNDKGLKFVREFIELAIANFTEIND